MILSVFSKGALSALRFESYMDWYMNHHHCAASSKVFLSSCSDAADQVVQGKGKFEELMVCSHEIAASTAQLVAASKVQRQKNHQQHFHLN